MAQLLLVRTKNTDYKEVGDIVGIYEDSHAFTPDTLAVLDVMKVEGYTREQLVYYVQGKTPQTERVWRSRTTQWTMERPEKFDAWDDRGTWRFLNERPKYEYTIRNMTEEEKAVITSKEASSFERLQALNHLEVTYGMIEKNIEAVPNLQNPVAIR